MKFYMPTSVFDSIDRFCILKEIKMSELYDDGSFPRRGDPPTCRDQGKGPREASALEIILDEAKQLGANIYETELIARKIADVIAHGRQEEGESTKGKKTPAYLDKFDALYSDLNGLNVRMLSLRELLALIHGRVIVKDK